MIGQQIVLCDFIARAWWMRNVSAFPYRSRVLILLLLFDHESMVVVHTRSADVFTTHFLIFHWLAAGHSIKKAGRNVEAGSSGRVIL